MPVFAADLLPDTTGRNLGNPSQEWNAYLQTLNVAGLTKFSPVPGISISPSGAISVLTAPITCNANSTSPQNGFTCPIPAGILNAQGKVLRATLTGTYTTQVGQAPIFALICGFDYGYRFFFVEVTLAAAQTANFWRMHFELVVYSAGTAGQLMPSGEAVTQNGIGDYRTQGLISLDPMLTAFDLTAAHTLTAACLFTTNTSPANICVTNTAIIEVLN